MFTKPVGHAVDGTLLTDAEEKQWLESFSESCCANCKFASIGSLTWETCGDTMRVEWGYVTCGRYPPVLVESEPEAMWAQPETAPAEWCGEWRESDE